MKSMMMKTTAIFFVLLLGMGGLMAGVASAADVNSAEMSVRINEVMYNPAGSEVEGEWIELLNNGSEPVNVTGWIVTDQDGSDDFVFPRMEMPPGAFVVLHAGSGSNTTDFASGSAHFYLFKHSAFLGNSGDDICLMNGSEVMDYVSYGNSTSIDRSPDSREFTPVPAVCENETIGRFNGTWEECTPTPGYRNTPVGMESSEDVTPDSEDEATVPLETAEQGARNNDSAANDSAANNTERVGETYPPLLITDVYYYSLLSESFTIYNPGGEAVSLSGWSFSDGEGTVFLPDNSSIGPFSHLVLAQNIEGYFEESGVIADLNWSAMEHSGTFRMNNDGDELFLYSPSSLTDAYVYGNSVYNGTGWIGTPSIKLHSTEVAHRKWTGAGYADSNSSADWDGNVSGIGRSSFSPVSVSGNFSVTAFSAPDNSYEALAGAIDSSRSSILLNVYEFTSYPLAGHLIDAAKRGVNITMLLEGGPVGGIPEEEISLCQRMHSAGIDIRFMVNDYAEKINDRYRFDHAKYAVMDGSRLAIMSENMGTDGFSPAHTGNRGWGLIINSTEIAGYFVSVFRNDSDTEMRDIASVEDMPFYSSAISYRNGIRATPSLLEPLVCTGNTTVTPVLSPDTSLSNDTILGMINSAKKSVYVEQFYIYKHWGSRYTGSVSRNPNPYLEAVVEAARRGCEVRVILDNTWYNSDPNSTVDNDDTIAYINEIAEDEGLNMEAKFISDCHNFTHVHNKGLIVDNRSVLVSSINWNENSVKENREAGVIVESEQIASYFVSLFESDWISEPSLSVRIDGDIIVRANESFTLTPIISVSNSSLASVFWSFDNATSNSYALNLSFNDSGMRNITVIVTDIYGRTASASVTVTVLPEISEKRGDKSDTIPGETASPVVSTEGGGNTGIIPSVIFAALAGVMAFLIIRAMKVKKADKPRAYKKRK